jgi:hypothetical protein
VWQKLFLLAVAVLFVGLVAHRVRMDARRRAMDSTAWMPRATAEADERELHLNPGGIYTLADIGANGRLVPSVKYRGFQARHDRDPQPGERLCPVTRTKASSLCTWVINGQEYQFCCPPCIDEFVRLAKESPSEIKPARQYVQP